MLRKSDYLTKRDFLMAQKGNDEKFDGIEKNFADLFEMLDKKFTETDKRLSNVEDELKGVKNLLYRHLEVDDDRYWEIKHRHQVYDYWFTEIAHKLNLQLSIPEKLKTK